jgi:hypothetical protein
MAAFARVAEPGLDHAGAGRQDARMDVGAGLAQPAVGSALAALLALTPALATNDPLNRHALESCVFRALP